MVARRGKVLAWVPKVGMPRKPVMDTAHLLCRIAVAESTLGTNPAFSAPGRKEASMAVHVSLFSATAVSLESCTGGIDLVLLEQVAWQPHSTSASDHMWAKSCIPPPPPAIPFHSLGWNVPCAGPQTASGAVVCVWGGGNIFVGARLQTPKQALRPAVQRS